MNIIDKLWAEYIKITPSAEKIVNLFEAEGEIVYNDHIAIRTFNLPECNIEFLSKLFLEMGYVKKGTYYFKQKKLNAVHYENVKNPEMPKIFISELILEEFDDFVRIIAKNCVNYVDHTAEELLLSGRVWNHPDHQIYTELLKASEYAAWMYVFGFRANHFTVHCNRLNNFETLESVNKFLKDNKFVLNTSGGEIKGSKEQLLEQSSIMADKVNITFIEGDYEIPSCYYEFAKRYKNTDGNLFEGFIASSADKIFESTDNI